MSMCDFLVESYFDKSPLILKLLFVSVAIFVIVISLNHSRKLIISSCTFTSDAGRIFPQTFLSSILDIAAVMLNLAIKWIRQQNHR